MSTDKLPDVWSPRDYLVLREACRLIDCGEWARTSQLEEATGLTAAEIGRAYASLRRDGLITEVDERGGTVMAVQDVSSEAYRRVGLYPDPHQDLADALVQRLLDAAEQTHDPADKSKLRQAASLVGEVTKSTVAGIVSGLVTGGFTG